MSNQIKSQYRTSESIDPLECYDLIIDISSLQCISSMNNVEEYGAIIKRD